MKKEIKSYLRAVIAKALSTGSDPRDYIERRWGVDAQATKAVSTIRHKAPVDPTAFPDADVPSNTFLSALIDQTIVGEMGLRRLPMDTRLYASTTAPTAHFVTVGEPVPITQGLLNSTILRPKKIRCAIVASTELLEHGHGLAEEWLFSEISGAVSAAVDEAFLDPANGGSASTPASITNGLTAVTGSADADADVKNLIEGYSARLERARFIARPETYAALNSTSRPFVGLRQGELLNAPAHATSGVPTTGGEHIVLADPGQIGLAMEGIEIQSSNEASLQLDDAPSSPSNQFSCFQNDAHALSATLHINWQVLNPDAVSLLSGGSY